MSEIPYVGYSDDSLDKQKRVELGELILCPHCGESHPLKGSDDGSTLIMVYRCGKKLYLGAINHCLVSNLKPDFSGGI